MSTPRTARSVATGDVFRAPSRDVEAPRTKRREGGLPLRTRQRRASAQKPSVMWEPNDANDLLPDSTPSTARSSRPTSSIIDPPLPRTGSSSARSSLESGCSTARSRRYTVGFIPCPPPRSAITTADTEPPTDLTARALREVLLRKDLAREDHTHSTEAHMFRGRVALVNNVYTVADDGLDECKNPNVPGCGAPMRTLQRGGERTMLPVKETAKDVLGVKDSEKVEERTLAQWLRLLGVQVDQDESDALMQAGGGACDASRWQELLHEAGFRQELPNANLVRLARPKKPERTERLAILKGRGTTPTSRESMQVLLQPARNGIVHRSVEDQGHRRRRYQARLEKIAEHREDFQKLVEEEHLKAEKQKKGVRCMPGMRACEQNLDVLHPKRMKDDEGDIARKEHLKDFAERKERYDEYLEKARAAEKLKDEKLLNGLRKDRERYEEELVHCAKVEEAKLAQAAREMEENRPPPRNPIVSKKYEDKLAKRAGYEVDKQEKRRQKCKERIGAYYLEQAKKEHKLDARPKRQNRAPKTKVLQHVTHDHNEESVEKIDRMEEVQKQAEYRALLDKQVESRDGRQEQDRVQQIQDEKSHLVHVEADFAAKEAKLAKEGRGRARASVEQKVQRLRNRAKNRRSSVTDVKEALKKTCVEGCEFQSLGDVGRQYDITKLQKFGVRRANDEKQVIEKRRDERLAARKKSIEYPDPTGLPLAKERLMQRGLHAGANAAMRVMSGLLLEKQGSANALDEYAAAATKIQKLHRGNKARKGT